MNRNRGRRWLCPGALLGLTVATAACQGEIDGEEPTPVPPPDPHDQIDEDAVLYWDSLAAGGSSSAFYAISGFSNEQLILCGEAGQVWEWDGNSLELLDSLTTDQGEAPDLNGIWTFSDSRGKLLFVAGASGAIFRYQFTYDGFELFDTHTRSEFRALIGFGRENVWAVGDGGVYHYDGVDWVRDTTVPGNPKLYNIWGPGEDDPEDLYVVGAAGSLLHRMPGNGGEYGWQPVSLGRGEDFHSIWGTGPSNIFVVGQEGLILNFDGTTWRTQEPLTFDHLWQVWGVDASTVFAAGTNGTTLLFDGSGWQPLGTGTQKNLYGLFGSDVNHVFSVGAWSTFLFYDNAPTPPPATQE